MNKSVPRLAATIILGCLLTSCATLHPKPIRETDYTAPIRVACVGDSITYGYGFKNRERDSYPAQLATMLGPKWVVGNFGVNGATLLKRGTRPYLAQQAFRDALAFNPDVVVIKLATNDTKPENWGTHRDEFLPDYLELIHRLSELKSKPRIYLCQPVPLFRDRGKKPDANDMLVEILPVIDQVGRRAGLPVIDLNSAFENQPERFPDGVHPDAQGAKLIARHVYTALRGTSPNVK